MAYVSLSNLRDARDLRTLATAVFSPAIMARSALVAMAAAAAILALSNGEPTNAAGTQSVAAKKADRLTAARPIAATAATTESGFVNDPSNRTTTIMRGAATPLSAASPVYER